MSLTLRFYVCFLKKHLHCINAKVSQEFRVTRIHLEDPSVSCVIATADSDDGDGDRNVLLEEAVN